MGSEISLVAKTVLHLDCRQLLSFLPSRLSTRLVRRFRYPLDIYNYVEKRFNDQRILTLVAD